LCTIRSVGLGKSETRSLQVGRKEEMKERGRVEEKAREREMEQRRVGVEGLGGAMVGV
jgi:hypothetical protein